MADSRIRISGTPTLFTPDTIEQYEFSSFQEFCTVLENGAEVWTDTGSKEKPKDLGLFLAVATWSTYYREAKNCRTMGRTFWADFDGLTDEQTSELLDTVEELGFAALVYTSWNHLTPYKHGRHCLRVIFELDQEYHASQHRQLWHLMNQSLGGLIDPQTKDPSRGFFYPAIRQGYEDHYLCTRIPGEPIPLGELLDSPPDPEALESQPTFSESLGPDFFERNQLIERVHLTTAVEAWSRYRGNSVERIEKATVARDAKRILQGKEPEHVQPGEGQRHGWMLALAGYLARQFPKADPEKLCQHFVGIGWDHFASGDEKDHGIPRLVTMVDDFQVKELEKLAQLEEDRREEQRQAILRSTGGQRDHTLTDEEASALSEHDPNWLQTRVLQYQRAHWLGLPDGTYNPKMWTKDELMLAVRDWVAVYGEWCTLYYEDPKTEEIRRHTYETFRSQYGTAIEDVRYDQTIPRTRYDPNTKALSIACAAPKVEPVYHEEIQKWLAWSGGDLLLDMLAGMTRLDQMLPVLVITGPAGCGKTLIAKACGQVFGGDPNSAKDTHTQYNADQMIRQPITLHDEKAGQAFEREGTSLIREYTTQGERWVEAKYLPKVKLIGYPRLIFCANNAHILDTQENMTAADRDAFAERLIHVEFRQEHSDYLDKHVKRTKEEWLEKRHLAQHILWLKENHTITREGTRFLVAGPRTRLHEGLAGGAGVAAEVIQWLLSYVADPEKVDSKQNVPVQLDAEKSFLRVTAQAVLTQWDVYMSTPKPLSTADVQRAITSISVNDSNNRPKVSMKVKGKTKYVNGYEVDLKTLHANLDRHYLSEEDFNRALGLEGEE